MLHAGAAQADITPAMDIQLAGDIGRPRPCQEVMDPLYARALVVADDQNNTTVCILSTDLLTFSNLWADKARQAVAKALDIGVEQIMLHATQSHSAPALGHFFHVDEERSTRLVREPQWIAGGDDRYHPLAVEGIVKAAREAAGRLKPATLSHGRTLDSRWAYNRRFLMRDGSTLTHALGRERANVMTTEGPIDPEVAVAILRDESNKPIASLLHYTAHPTFGYPKNYCSADWCGVWADSMVEHLGEDCINLVINGCCGNISPSDSMDPTFRRSQQAMGEGLAGSAAFAIEKAVQLDNSSLSSFTQIQHLDLRHLTDEERQWATDMLEKHPEPQMREDVPGAVTWDWIYACGQLDVQDFASRGETFPYIVQGFRLGDLALIGLMGEPFVEAQLAIKIASPTQHTIVAHMCNGYAGYIPTPWGLELGGYETRTSIGSRFRSEALDQIVTTSDNVLSHLWQTSPKKAKVLGFGVGGAY